MVKHSILLITLSIVMKTLVKTERATRLYILMCDVLPGHKKDQRNTGQEFVTRWF